MTFRLMLWGFCWILVDLEITFRVMCFGDSLHLHSSILNCLAIHHTQTMTCSCVTHVSFFPICLLKNYVPVLARPRAISNVKIASWTNVRYDSMVKTLLLLTLHGFVHRLYVRKLDVTLSCVIYHDCCGLSMYSYCSLHTLYTLQRCAWASMLLFLPTQPHLCHHLCFCVSFIVVWLTLLYSGFLIYTICCK